MPTPTPTPPGDRPVPLAYRYPDLDPCTLAEARAAIEEAIDLAWLLNIEHVKSDADASRAEDRFVAVGHLVEYLASLLDGVLADDPQAIRDAAAWLTANRPAADGGDTVGEGEG